MPNAGFNPVTGYELIDRVRRTREFARAYIDAADRMERMVADRMNDETK